MKKIAIIGECMIELNGQPFGSMQQTYGGDTLNAAVYLARAAKQQPVAIHYVSALGDDALSEGMRKRWQQEGINTEWVLRDSTRSPGLYMIQLDEHGERSYFLGDSRARRSSAFVRLIANAGRCRGRDSL